MGRYQRKISDMVEKIARLEDECAWCMGDGMRNTLGLEIVALRRELHQVINAQIAERARQMRDWEY